MQQNDEEKDPAHIDFFIIYENKDKPYAEWIADQLKEAGYTTFVTDRDIRPGDRIVRVTNDAVRRANRAIIVFSRDNQDFGIGSAAWTRFVSEDPTASQRLLVPVIIQPCKLTTLLEDIKPINLVDCDTEQEKKRCLLDGIQANPPRPQRVPFPTSNATPVDSIETRMLREGQNATNDSPSNNNHQVFSKLTVWFTE